MEGGGGFKDKLPTLDTFILRYRKHVPCFYRVRETRVKVWENEKCCGNTSRRRVLPNFHDTKKKINLFTLIIKM